jgi:hypothetical protein
MNSSIGQMFTPLCSMCKASNWRLLSNWSVWRPQKQHQTIPPLCQVSARYFTSGASGSCHQAANALLQVQQLMRRVSCTSFADSHEKRFHFFSTSIWPRISEAGVSGLLIFASSYFEFVHLRGFLKQQRTSLAVNCEYTDNSNVMRARSRFRTGDRKVLLYTERAHFYYRPQLKCALGMPSAYH